MIALLMHDTHAALDQMIAQQVRTCEVLDARALQAMRQVRRELFVPAAWRARLRGSTYWWSLRICCRRP